MFSNTSAAFAVNYSARALAPRSSCTSSSQWVVGTCSPRDKNEVTVLSHVEEENGLESVAFYHHPDEVWALETPSDPKLGELVLTSGRAASGKTSLKLWRMKGLDSIREGEAREQDPDTNSSSSSSSSSSSRNEYGANDNGLGEELSLEADFDAGESKFSAFVSGLRWNTGGDGGHVATKDPHYLRLWAVDSGGGSGVAEAGKVELSFPDDENGEQRAPAFSGEWTGGGVAWGSGGAGTVAVAVQSQIQVVDARSLKTSTLIPIAHMGGTKDVDFNPNRPEMIVSAGADRFTKIWDLRNTKEPLVKVLSGHSHWVSCVRYNPVHDQLIMTGGTDNVVNLWRVASCGKAPWLAGEDAEEAPQDINAKQIDQHEDSVCSVAWGTATPWTCCSLSYDGRVILSHVPSTEKYKILL